MAGPLAGAGAVSVALLSSARAILGPKKTAEFAIKGSKFLSNQVEKARKLMNKPTAGQGLSPFEKAFAAARDKGVKTFPYKGDVYNTKLKTKVKPKKK